MRFSFRSEYGLRALTVLAMRGMAVPVPLREIAKSEAISEAFLEQIFVDLRRSGLVTSVRGARGGYRLARAPETIAVIEVLSVLEGDIAPFQCVAPNQEDSCERIDDCGTRQVWLKLQATMAETLRGISLRDLMQEDRVPKDTPVG